MSWDINMIVFHKQWICRRSAFYSDKPSTKMCWYGRFAVNNVLVTDKPRA